MRLRATVIGSAGQDGQILTMRLTQMGWGVGLIDRPSEIQNEKTLLQNHIEDFQPDVIFNLAGFSSVWRSWVEPGEAVLGNVTQFANLFEAHRNAGSKARVITTGSSELFEVAGESVNEDSPYSPTSPYAITKQAGVSLAKAYRQTANFDVRVLHLFNHESPLRPEHFVSQKIATGAARVKLGVSKNLSLGNIDVSRDWGYAPDFVDAMLRVAQLSEPEDFVVATGVLTPLTDLIERAFAAVGIDDWQSHVISEDRNLRPNDHTGAWGDSSKLQTKTGWETTKSALDTIEEMTHHQLLKLQGETTDQDWLERLTA